MVVLKIVLRRPEVLGTSAAISLWLKHAIARRLRAKTSLKTWQRWNSPSTRLEAWATAEESVSRFMSSSMAWSFTMERSEFAYVESHAQGFLLKPWAAG